MWDDYHLLLDFINAYAEAGGLVQQLELLFSPVSNYLFTTIRLVAVLDYRLFGELNFTHLIFVNSVLHICIYLLLLRIFRFDCKSFFFFLPVAMLMAIPTFQVQNWGSYTAHVFAIFFILLTMALVAKPTPSRWLLGLVTATLAGFSAGAGFLAFLCTWPLLQKFDRRRQALWMAIFVLILAFYIWLMLPLGPEFKKVASIRPSVLIYGLNAVLFYGSFFKDLYGDHHHWAAIFGGIMVLFFLWVVIFERDLIRRKPLLASGLLLAILLALVISIMRSRHGLGTTTTQRYRLFQVLPVIFAYIYFINQRPRLVQRFFPAILIFSVVFYGFRLENNLSDLANQRNRLQTGMNHFQITDSPDQLNYIQVTRGAEILRLSQQLGTYRYRDLPFQTLEFKPNRRLGILQPMKYVIDKKEDDPLYFHLQGWAFPAYYTDRELDILVVINENKNKHYFKTGPLLHPEVFINQAEKGFSLTLSKENLSFEWKHVEVGLALYRPYQGIIAETWINQ